jgi:hypothetical protein
MKGPVPLALRTAKVSSFCAKFCGFSTLFLTAQAWLTMRTPVSWRSSTGLGPARLSSTVSSSILRTPVTPAR